MNIRIFIFLLILLFPASKTLQAQNGIMANWANVLRHPSVVDYGSADLINFDPSGNVIIAGHFKGVMDFDPHPVDTFYLTASGQTDIFLAKYNASGDFLWAFRLNVGNLAFFRDMDIDEGGNIYVTASMHGAGAIDVDPTSDTVSVMTNSFPDLFVAKYSPTSDCVWAINLTDVASTEHGNGLALDGQGYFYLTGQKGPNLDFDPSAATYNVAGAGGMDAYIAKYDTSGNFIWAHNIGGTNDDYGYNVQSTPAGNVLVSGKFKGTVDFDPSAATLSYTAASSNEDVFMALFSGAGSLIWAKQLAGISTKVVASTAVDAGNNAYIGVRFDGTIDADPSAGVTGFTSLGSDDALIAKYDMNGNIIWAHTIASAGNDYLLTMVNDVSGNIYCSGAFAGSVDFDLGAGTSLLNSFTSAADLFIAKYDPAGDLQWAKAIGDSGYIDGGYAMDVDTAGNILLSMLFTDTVDVDPSAATLFIPTYTTGTTCVFAKYTQGLCGLMVLSVDSVNDVSCQTGTGAGFSHAYGGVSPYTYTWNTTPVTNNSMATFTQPGMYSLTATDANACVINKTVLVGGAQYQSGFDLNANLVATTLQSGFPATLYINGFNDGCTPVTGQLQLVLNNDVTFTSAVPAPSVVNGDTLMWNFTSLTYDSAHIIPAVNVTVSPTTVIGDTLCFALSINPEAGDSDTSNNVKTYCIPVVNAYDPNIKDVYPQGMCLPRFTRIDETHTYTIHFQNTGNAAAVNIVVLDTIPAAFDVNTLRVIGNSHAVVTEMDGFNIVRFVFNNIMLPDSTSNEPASHGYVIFEVDAFPAVTPGTVANNTAHIYFDFNPPVSTNSVFNTLLSALPLVCNVNVNETENDDRFNVYPNPATSVLYLEIPEALKKQCEVYIINSTGQVMEQKKLTVSRVEMDVHHYSSGMYSVIFQTTDGVVVQKFIIQR